MNPMLIDVLFVLLLCLVIITSYKKGLIVRLYDFFTFILSLILAYVFAKPLSTIVTIYPYHSGDIYSSLIGEMINQIIIFVLLFIGLCLLKNIIGFIIKPLLSGITDFFHLTKWANHLAGSLIGLCEFIMIWYIAIVFVFLPFFPNSRTMLQQTTITKQVISIIPEIGNVVLEQDFSFNSIEDRRLETVTKTTLFAYNHGFINDEQFVTVYEDYIRDLTKHERIHFTENDKIRLRENLENNAYQDIRVKNIIIQLLESDKK